MRNLQCIHCRICILLLVLLMVSRLVDGDTSRAMRSCGEECVHMILGAYGIQATEEEIYKRLSPDKNGVTSFKDISRCLKSYGLKPFGFMGDPEELLRISHPTVICLVNDSENKIGHFIIVMYDPKSNKCIGYDPIQRGVPAEVKQSMLDRYWTGHGLIVYPRGADIGPGETDDPSLGSASITVVSITFSLLGGTLALIMAKHYSLKGGKDAL